MSFFYLIKLKFGNLGKIWDFVLDLVLVQLEKFGNYKS